MQWEPAATPAAQSAKKPVDKTFYAVFYNNTVWTISTGKMTSVEQSGNT